MSKEQKDTLYTMISDLSEDAYEKVVDYITYLRYTLYIKNEAEIEDEEDLYNKLEEARLDIENGNGVPMEEAFASIENKHFANK